MKPGITHRIKAAFGLIVKGSIAPFDRMIINEGMGSPKLDQPFSQSPWVMRAIKSISGPISAVDLEFGSVEGRKKKPVEDPVLSEFWSAPAAGMTLSDFIEATVGWLKMAGEFFWIMDDSWLVPFMDVGKRGKLIVARPDRMRPIFQGDTVQYWEFTDARGNRHALLPDQVVQGKCWNPYDAIRGLSEYQSVKTAAEADYLAANFNRNLMANNGDQGVYVIGKSGMPNDQQREQIVSILREKRAAAQRGQYKPVFLTGDISIEDPKVQVPDANFLANRLENRHEIYIALGVPPSMADVTASYSIGSASDRYRLIEETCMPMAAKIADKIEQVVNRQTGMALRAWFDWDDHTVMQAVRRERLEAAAKLWATGMPMDKISEYLGLELPEFDGWDIGYLPFSVAPVGAAEHTPATDATTSTDFAEAPKEPDAPDSVQEMWRVLRCDHGNPSQDHGEDFQTRRPAREVKLWQKLMAQRRETIKSYQSRFGAILMAARKETLAKLAKGEKALTKSAAADFIFSLSNFKSTLLTAMRNVAAKALQTSGEQLYAELGKDDPFTMAPAEVMSFARSRVNKLSECADDIWASIKGEIEEGLQSGESTLQIAGRVKGAFNGIESKRAKTIAMTETSAAYGQGRQEAMRSAGVQFKQWLTSGNDNVRPAHADANGQTVPISEAYQVGGEALMHPGDPDGSASNVINCHCVSIAVESMPEEQQ